MQRISVAIAIYNQGSALIQDRRQVELQAGENHFEFRDVAGTIDATSVQFKARNKPQAVKVLEQTFAYDLVDIWTLLKRYIDQQIEVTTEDATQFDGLLLAAQGNDILLRSASGEILALKQDAIRDLRFPDLPKGLITRPTLRWIVYSQEANTEEIDLTYLAYGLNWTADYVVLLNADEQSLDLNGWVTLTNETGTAYEDAHIKLVAGEVHRIRERAPQAKAMRSAAPLAFAAAPMEDAVEQREFSEYKLYEVKRRVTLNDRETKQVEFVGAAGVKCAKYFVYENQFRFTGGWSGDQNYGAQSTGNAGIYLEFKTSKASGLDIPLPAGRLRVYQNDIDDAALLIGESHIKHTPRGDKVRVLLGQAFDIRVERTQTQFRAVAKNVIEETYEIVVHNHKQSGSVEVRVVEHLYRWNNWTLLDVSHSYEQVDATTIEFKPQVEAESEVTLTYKVRYSYPTGRR